jgi:hypothetical protein
MMKRVLAIAVVCGWLAALAPTLHAQSSFLTIQPSQVAGITSATTTRNTVVLGAFAYSRVDLLINITGAGAATGTLQLFVEDSADGGTTWDDLVTSLTFTFGGSLITQRFFISGLLVPSTITTATSTNLTQGSAAAVETLAAGSARQGPFGDTLRVREKVSGASGSPTGPTYTITAVFR